MPSLIPFLPSSTLVSLLFALTTSSFVSAIPSVLVYYATAGYVHESIPTAIDVLGQNGPKYNISFTFTADPNYFIIDTLSNYDCVMFILNSDEVLNSTGQAALQTYFQSGGVYTGVHSASACLFNDTNYQQAVGALFDYHPTIQFATFERLNDTFPATANLPDRWSYTEEVYYFRSDPRTAGATVVLTVDESSYINNGTTTGNYPSQGSPHPIAWFIEEPESSQPLMSGAPKAGRSFYTALGHLSSTWQNETFIDHVMSGLVWALEGASTRAYGIGLVGNSTGVTNSTSSSSSSSNGSMTTSHSASSVLGSSTAKASGASGSASAASVGGVLKIEVGVMSLVGLGAAVLGGLFVLF